MGCVASKLEEEEEVVAICRERKRQLKLAVERRYALADAHCRYYHSLYAVSAAIRLFVARHSVPPSPFLITFPPPCTQHPPSEDNNNVITNLMFLQQTPSEPSTTTTTTKRAISGNHQPECSTCSGDETSSDEEMKNLDDRQGNDEHGCGYFYTHMPSPQRDFGWDFFNPFDGVRQEVIHRPWSEDDLRAVREREGIPDLEEECAVREEMVVKTKVVVTEESGNPVFDIENEAEATISSAANMSQEGQKAFSVMSPVTGRELLEALKDIEDYFVRAFDSGKDVSRMLEANRVHLQSGLQEIKGNSSKLIQAIAWNRSMSSRSSSCRSLVTSSSKSSSTTWTEFKNNLFDDYGGMVSGNHSLTLRRLYAWEKKLFEEVKSGDATRKIYEKKCAQLRNHDVKGDDMLTMDKTRAAVKDLYARIMVAIRSAESISIKIEKIRDEELKPQIVELLHGLMKTWTCMSESHECQNRILREVKTFSCPSYGKFCNDSHRLATLQLEAELRNWRACFIDYVAEQKGYMEALSSWLSKFVAPESEFCTKGRRPPPPFTGNGPPLLVICHDWLACMDRLPYKSVSYAMKSFAKDMRALWIQQGEEQNQKRKVDSLAKELDRKVITFHKADKRVVQTKILELKLEPEWHEDEYLTEKKDHLEILRRKLGAEKEKHENHMEETQKITLNGFQTGFSSLFESLTIFSKASLNMYSDLLSYNEKAEKLGDASYIYGSQVEENCSR